MLTAIDALRPHPRNPNHGNVEAIADSIRANGFFGAVIAQASTRTILVGEHRWRAAEQAGLTEIPVFLVDVDDRAALKILLADNRLGELGERDPTALAQLLGELEAEGDLEGTGYNTQDYLDLLDDLGDQVLQQGLTDEDDVPELQPEAVTRTGELWLIGEHRLMVGDATDAQVLKRLVGEKPVDLIWTDPPYNVNYEGKTKDRLKIENDAMSPEQFRAFLTALFKSASGVLKRGGCVYIAYAETEVESFRAAMKAAGLSYRQTVIWVKNAAVLSRQDYNWRHEPILYGWKDGAGHFFNGDFTQNTVVDDTPDYRKLKKEDLVAILEGQRDAIATTVIYEDKPTRNDLHPTMKPVRLVQRFLISSSKSRQTVLDMCGGSGTTLIAAFKTGRHARLCELDPRYADQILRRAQDHTGLTATREDGRTFAELEAERAA